MRLVSAILATLALSLPALAQTPAAACWYRDLERLDFTMNPPQGGDADFFTKSDVPPNVMWLLDDSGSMQTLPCEGDCNDYLKCTDGTKAGFYDADNNFFRQQGWLGYVDDASAYPAFDPEFCTGSTNTTCTQDSNCTGGEQCLGGKCKNPRGWSDRDGCYKPGLLHRFHVPSEKDSCPGFRDNGNPLGGLYVQSGPDVAASIPNFCAGRVNPIRTLDLAQSCTAHTACCVGPGKCGLAYGYACQNDAGVDNNSASSQRAQCRIPMKMTGTTVAFLLNAEPNLTTRDVSVNFRAATTSGTAGASTDQPRFGAASFNLSNTGRATWADGGTLSDRAGRLGFTADFWIRAGTQSGTTTRTIFQKSNGTSTGWIIDFLGTTGQVRFRIFNGTTTPVVTLTSTSSIVTAPQWTYVAVVRVVQATQDTYYMYVNNALQGSAITTTTLVNLANTDAITLGATTNGIAAQLDAVRFALEPIYNGAPATIVVPTDAPESGKMNCTKAGYTCPSGYSCDTVAASPTFDQCINLAEPARCTNHLKTYGYYNYGDGYHPYLLGDVLNYYPSKVVVARKVVKDMVRATPRVRQGLMTFAGGFGRIVGTGHFGPGCNIFFPPKDPDYLANRTAISGLLDAMDFDQGTPLGAAMTNVAEYFSGSASRFRGTVKANNTAVATSSTVWGDYNTGVFGSSTGSRSGDSDPICASCQKNFALVVSDGFPNEASANNTPCTLRNYDKDCLEGVKSPGGGGLAAKDGLQNSPLCGTSAGTCPKATTGRDFTGIASVPTGYQDYFDDVTAFAQTEDLRPDQPDKQNLTTHTVGFGIRPPIFEDAARKGGGFFYLANNADELRSSLSAALQEIQKRATSFSVASVTTVQTRGDTYAFVPRFKPAVDDIWEGHLYRYKLYNEFAAGCTPDDMQAPLGQPLKTLSADSLSRNKNGNDSCTDVYLLDANDDVVQENDDGDYVHVDVQAGWNMDPADGAIGWKQLKIPTSFGVPVWDAATVLATRNVATSPRKIFTVIDKNSNKVFDPGEEIDFTSANAAQLLPYLAIGKFNEPFCSDIAARLVKTYTTDVQCATDLIEFVRGTDVFDDDKDGNKTELRSKLLGDIFHSSPILVTPPVPDYLCDSGRFNQCVSSLYAPSLTPNGRPAYTGYLNDNVLRTEFVLVGANDGMLHAFHAGDRAAATEQYSLGTGAEMWAFIPPDLIAKLKRLAARDGRHEYFVDGTAAVRDIWVDSASNPGQKDKSEFKTIAIVGERGGGRSYFALDVSNPTSPAFRWSYPPITNTSAFEMGQTWNDHAPSPPPIGPVALADSSGPISISTSKAKETWVAMFGGGYDDLMLRGRGVYMVDAWTGKEIWRFTRGDSTGTSDPRNYLSSVAATPSMFSTGQDPAHGLTVSGLFDTAVVGDLGGSVWAFRFHSPGVLDGTTGRVNNWFGGRAFTTAKTGKLALRQPFFYMAYGLATAEEAGGVLRIAIGAGDRSNIRDAGGGECNLINLGACVRKGCDVAVEGFTNGTNTIQAVGNNTLGQRWSLPADGTALSESYAIATNSNFSCSDTIEQHLKVAATCGSYTQSKQWQLKCDWNASASGDCPIDDPKPDPLVSTLSVAAPSDFPKARFYTFKPFDGSSTHPTFTSSTNAATFDTNRLTDTNLVNVTNAPISPVATTQDTGWFVEYQTLDERTSSAPVLTDTCLLWQTLTLDTSGGSGVACGSKVADIGRTYHGHAISGDKGCGFFPSSSARYSSRKAIVPPPPPTPVVAINRETGQILYSEVSIEPGSAPQQTAVTITDIAGSIYWLEVPREVHECRHGTGACQ